MQWGGICCENQQKMKQISLGGSGLWHIIFLSLGSHTPGGESCNFWLGPKFACIFHWGLRNMWMCILVHFFTGLFSNNFRWISQKILKFNVQTCNIWHTRKIIFEMPFMIFYPSHPPPSPLQPPSTPRMQSLLRVVCMPPARQENGYWACSFNGNEFYAEI